MLKQSDIQKITNRIVDIAKPLSVYLFGSYAKGKNTPNSDIDLCIVYPDPDKPVDLIDIRLSLKSISQAFDLVAFSEDDFRAQKAIWWSIPGQIEQEGIKLYDRAT